MLVMKIWSASPANRPVKRIYVHVQKKKIIKKKWLFTAGCFQRLEKAGCQWLSSNKKKKCLSVDLLNLKLNSLLVKRQIDNPSPGAVTGGN